MASFYKNFNFRTALNIASIFIYKNSYLCGARFVSFRTIFGNAPKTSDKLDLIKSLGNRIKKMTTSETSSVNELQTKMEACHISKPPNILIYCKKDRFLNIQSVVNRILNSDRYVVYHLSDQQSTTTPWSDHAELVLVAQTLVPKSVSQQFLHFHQNGGKVLCFSCDLINSLIGTDYKNTPPEQMTIKYKGKNFGQMPCAYHCSGELDPPSTSLLAHTIPGGQSVIFAVQGNGTTICSLVDLLPMGNEADSPEGNDPVLSKERFELLKDIFETEFGLDCSQDPTTMLTKCYLLGSAKEKCNFLKKLGVHLPVQSEQQHLRLKSINLVLCPPDDGAHPSPTPTSHLLPIMVGQDAFASPYFNSEIYFRHLKTKSLGRVVVYGDVIATTMTLVQELTDHPEIVTIAGRQTQGKGRSGNAWLSPEGCAMFSFPVVFNLDSKLGHRPSFVQHLAALAIVEGILEVPGYEKLDIRLKWPNDIYIGQSKIKIGGLIVTSTILKKQIHCVIGCGVNVANKHPTTCLNDVIVAYNSEHNSNLSPMTTDQFIAQTLNCFEKILDTFQIEGHQAVIPRYLERWMHSGSEVSLSDGGRGVVQGLDEFGFLTIKMTEGVVMSVQPDGNSLDMLHNLISTKADRQ